MRDKKITVEQFSEMMKGVFQLKEHAMMQQAERRHIRQQMINPWQDGSSPADNPQLPQHPFTSATDGLKSITSNMGLPIEGLQGMPPPMLPGPQFVIDGESHSMNDQTVGQTNSNIGFAFANRDLPIANDTELAAALDDPVKRIEIDEYPRDIRFYGETALIIMGPEAKDMRELRFKNEFGSSSHRRIIIDQKYIIQVEIASPSYTEFKLDDGVTHTIKIGAPTRELWIDGQGHELYFNKSGSIQIGTSFHDVFLEGPAPNVDIGKLKLNGRNEGIIPIDTSWLRSIRLQQINELCIL